MIFISIYEVTLGVQMIKINKIKKKGFLSALILSNMNIISIYKER